MNKRFLAQTLIVALLLSAVSVGIVKAANSVVLNGYEIEYLGIDMNGSTGTLTYAVTADPTVNTITRGLSHWTIGIGDNCTVSNIVAPATTSSYVNPTDDPGCGNGTYSCQAATHNEIEYGLDPTTGVTGVKFGDANEEQLSNSNPGTQIFRIQIENVIGTQDVLAGVKTQGNSGPSGLITGARCDNPTAVSLSSVSAKADTGSIDIPLLMVVMLLAGTSLILWRRV